MVASRLTPALALAAALLASASSGAAGQVVASPPLDAGRGFSWWRFGVGFVSSILAHETGHIVTAAVVGGAPSIGFNKARPVVYSGIDADVHPHRQFAFSAAGMTVQMVLNEVILDWPRTPNPSGEFERGMLAGGIGTVLFYFTVGRNSPVSDVHWMAQTSGLSKWTLTAIFGGVAASDVVRIVLKRRYAHFFAYPGLDGRLRFGAQVTY